MVRVIWLFLFLRSIFSAVSLGGFRGFKDVVFLFLLVGLVWRFVLGWIMVLFLEF